MESIKHVLNFIYHNNMQNQIYFPTKHCKLVLQNEKYGHFRQKYPNTGPHVFWLSCTSCSGIMLVSIIMGLYTQLVCLLSGAADPIWVHCRALRSENQIGIWRRQTVLLHVCRTFPHNIPWKYCKRFFIVNPDVNFYLFHNSYKCLSVCPPFCLSRMPVYLR